MKCKNAQMFFDRMYREGEQFDRPDIAAHVGNCEQCGRDYEKWRMIAAKFTDTPAPVVPSALFGNVMRAIETAPAAGRLQWLPPQWKLPAYGMAFAALLLTAGISLFIARPRTPEPALPAVSSNAQPIRTDVMTHFEIALANVHQVAVVGDFNGWNKEEHLLARADDGTWKIDLPLPKGCYQYQFLIDGKQWRTDPGRKQIVPDGFGGFNTVIEL